MIKFIVFLSLLVCFQINANTKSPQSNLQYEIVDGDLTSHFTITKNKNDAEIEFANSLGRHEVRKIKLKDYKFLVNESSAYKGQNSKEFCPRSYIEFKNQKSNHLGCIGSPTQISRQMTQTTALLSLLF